jgi:hypothetical protein
MKAKIIAVMAILAIAFAGFAIAAEQTDAEDLPALALDKSTYYVKPDGTTTTVEMVVSVTAAVGADLPLTITGQETIVTTSESPKIESGQLSCTVVITYVADGNTTLTVSAENYTSATATVYAGIQQLDAPAYFKVSSASTTKTVDIKGNIPAGLTLTAVSSAGDDSKLGDMTVTVATAGTAVLTTAPTSENEFVGSEIVTIKNGNTAVGSIIVYSDTATAMAFVQNSMQSTGDGAISNAPAAKSVQAMVYSDAVVHIDGSAIDSGQVPMLYFTITFDPTSTAGDEKTLTYGPIAAQKRMTIDIPGYVLFDNTATTTIKIMNWSDKLEIATLDAVKTATPISFTLDANLPPNAVGTAKKSDGTTDFVSSYTAPARYSAVETAITSTSLTFVGWATAADATTSSFPTLVIADEEMGAGKSPKLEEYFFATKGNLVSTEYKIFAIWDDKLTIEVLYMYKAAAVSELNGNVYKSTQTPGTDDPIAKVIQVPSYAKVGDSFLLRIQQATAGNYTYDVKLYTEYKWESSLQSTEATLETPRMITNGVWLIDDIKENIKIVVTATDASTKPVTGYHFAIDEVTKSTNEGNSALLSWDAIDYKPAGKIKIGGTYYRDIPGIGNVYGDISLLEAISVPTYELTVDNEAQTAPTENIVNLAGTYNEHTESYNFDYKLSVGEGYTIYAAQGLWDVNGDGTYEKFTPWSLIAQS